MLAGLVEKQTQTIAQAYPVDAQETGWYGPQVAFGLIYEFIRPGQLILDIGIGTGSGAALFSKAGLTVHGMDYSREMLDACGRQGFSDLKRHDLRTLPYPYASACMDHVMCIGVLNFYRDLTPVFAEAARILRPGGFFVFGVADPAENGADEIIAGPGHSGSDPDVTLYCHSSEQIRAWIEGAGFALCRTLSFSALMCRRKTTRLHIKACLAQKAAGTNQHAPGRHEADDG